MKNAPGWINTLIRSTLADILGESLPDNARLTRVQFVWHAAKHISANSVIPWPTCLELAREALKDWLKEVPRYGHRDYGWDKHAARTIAQEYVLDHCEPRP